MKRSLGAFGSYVSAAADLNVGLLSQVYGIRLLSHQSNAPQLVLLNCSSLIDLFCLCFWLSRARREPWGRGSHPTACHLSSGGDGSVQQQAQTKAGPPQPGDRRAHVTPHIERRNANTHIYIHCGTLVTRGCIHRRCRVTKTLHSVSVERDLLSYI